MNTSAPFVSHFQLISFDGGTGGDSSKFGGAALNSKLNVSELKLRISVRTALEMGRFGEMIQVWVLCPQNSCPPPTFSVFFRTSSSSSFEERAEQLLT